VNHHESKGIVYVVVMVGYPTDLCSFAKMQPVMLCELVMDVLGVRCVNSDGVVSEAKGETSVVRMGKVFKEERG
jgi:hypothetical protein